MSELAANVIELIQKLRKSIEIEKNWVQFQEIVESSQDQIIAEFSMRWLCSICDTYADFGSELARRNALAISMFVNMVRFAETLRYISGPVSAEKVAEAKRDCIPLYDDLVTFHINRQDVFLNLSKRMARQLEEDVLMKKIWREVLARFGRGDNVITLFSEMSDVPHRYFPVDPLMIKDNYGIA